jgi:hypothetical protein
MRWGERGEDGVRTAWRRKGREVVGDMVAVVGLFRAWQHKITFEELGARRVALGKLNPRALHSSGGIGGWW